MSKYFYILLISLLPFIGISQVDSTITSQAEFVYIDGLVEPSMVILNDTTFFIFTNSQVQVVNNNNKMMELMESLITKYDVEGAVSVQVLANLESQIKIMDENILVLNGLIVSKDSVIASLENKIGKMEDKNENTDGIIDNLNEQNSNLEKENKKLKLRSKLTMIGSGVIIVLILIALI